MATDDERREVARRLREIADRHDGVAATIIERRLGLESDERFLAGSVFTSKSVGRLADLIEPSNKPDAEYEAWYNNLSHYDDKRGGPSTIRELIEEIVWAALTVDLGPNGNTDPSMGIDEGDVYTSKLFAEWEREALRLSGGIDRDALLALADEMQGELDECADDHEIVGKLQYRIDRIREALGVEQ